MFKESLENFVLAENKNGKKISLDWDKAQVAVRGETLDLRELAGLCYYSQTEAYGEKIAASFEQASKRLELLAQQGRNFEAVSAFLSLKLVNEPETAGRDLVLQRDIPGTATLLVFDLGTWTLPASRSNLALWEKPETFLFQQGRRHILAHIPVGLKTSLEEFMPGMEQSRYRKFFSNSSQTAALALALNEIKDFRSDRGFLLCLPDWNTVLFIPLEWSDFPFRSVGLIKESIETLSRSPAPLSSNLIWYDGKAFQKIACERNSTIGFQPVFPEKLKALLPK